MSRKKKPRMEYRYYEVPEKCPVLVLQGVILCQEKVQIKNDFFPSCQHT